MADYVGDPYLYAKLHDDTITPKYAKMRIKFFWFFRQPTAKTPALIFTINTSNDAVSRKDVPFGSPENKILHFDPISPKRKLFANFRRDLIRKFRVKKA